MDEHFFQIECTLGQGAALFLPLPPKSKKIVNLLFGSEPAQIRCPDCGFYPKEHMGKWSCNCRVYATRTAS